MQTENQFIASSVTTSMQTESVRENDSDCFSSLKGERISDVTDREDTCVFYLFS